MRQKTPKLQFGPETPMPQLLEVIFGVFNNQDQAEEGKKGLNVREDRLGLM